MKDTKMECPKCGIMTLPIPEQHMCQGDHYICFNCQNKWDVFDGKVVDRNAPPPAAPSLSERLRKKLHMLDKKIYLFLSDYFYGLGRYFEGKSILVGRVPLMTKRTTAAVRVEPTREQVLDGVRYFTEVVKQDDEAFEALVRGVARGKEAQAKIQDPKLRERVRSEWEKKAERFVVKHDPDESLS